MIHLPLLLLALAAPSTKPALLKMTFENRPLHQVLRFLAKAGKQRIASSGACLKHRRVTLQAPPMTVPAFLEVLAKHENLTLEQRDGEFVLGCPTRPAKQGN